MKTALGHHHARMQRVLAYIDQHLEDDLDLDTLSGVASFSKFHFHRQFTATFGLSLHRYVQLMRMKRASYRLAYRNAYSVTDIAMDAGYDAPDAFARAFRRRFGQSPSSFRKAPNWQPWLAAFGPLNDARNKLTPNVFTAEEVAIREMPAMPVAIMEHRGDPATVAATIQRFIAWRKEAGLSFKTHPTFNIFHCDPRTTQPDEFRLDLCVGSVRQIGPSAEQITFGIIPGGRCAVLRIVGHRNDLEPAALYLYRDWLPASGEEARDFPLYCQHLAVFPDVPAHEAIVDLLLPLK